jgi:hypothetical protein
LTVVVWTTPFDIDWKPVMETGLGYCSVRWALSDPLDFAQLSLPYLLSGNPRSQPRSHS